MVHVSGHGGWRTPTSCPRCSVGAIRQTSTVDIQLSGTREGRSRQSEQVHYYLQAGGGLKVKTKRGKVSRSKINRTRVYV